MDIEADGADRNMDECGSAVVSVDIHAYMDIYI